MHELPHTHRDDNISRWVNPIAVVILAEAADDLTDRLFTVFGRQPVEHRAERNGDIVKMLPQILRAAGPRQIQRLRFFANVFETCLPEIVR